MITAVFIKRLKGWLGDARLYRLSEPVDPRGEPTQFVVVSAVTADITGDEVLIFPADKAGRVDDYREMTGSQRGTLEHADAIRDAGWTLAMNDLDAGSWIANPNCLSPGVHEQLLIARRAEIQVIGIVVDAEANYSFDDYALVRLDGIYYLLRTSGCSCPSPEEEWSVAFGPATLAEVRSRLASDAGEPDGYGVTKRQADEFAALCDAAVVAEPQS